jgi:AhpD family alkylhydroperoxidase
VQLQAGRAKVIRMSERIAHRRVAADTLQKLLGVHEHLCLVMPDARLRALVEIRVSQMNGCAFCLDMHTTEARQAGETQQRLDCLAAWREAPFFSDRERAALAWAEAVTRVEQTHVPDEVYAAVKAQFADKELADLTVVIGMINLWNRLNVAFRREPEPRAGG